MNQRALHKLISGQSSGLGAGILRFFLRLAAGCYSTAVELRNFLYSRGWLKINQTNAVVISVGNITAGGTGKTPLVIWLCSLLRKKNIDCAILTRGYKATADPRHKTKDPRDEPAILAQNCPEAKVIVNPDRVAGANEAIEKFAAKILVMDDGFQHRRLARDLDIVTIDATLPFGYGKVLPAGLLREPIDALKRADAAVITRCDQIEQDELDRLEEKLKKINPDMTIARSAHSAVCAALADDGEIGIEQLKNKKIFAFCGIGNPNSFLDTIRKLDANLVGSWAYNDHHRYTDKDIADIYEKARDSNTDLILTTQKDWTKIALSESMETDIPFAYLAIELKFTAGENKITQLIEEAMKGKIQGD